MRPGGVRIHNQKIHVNMNRNHVLDDAEMFLFCEAGWNIRQTGNKLPE